ncbi:YfhE-like protein [Bacillus sp. OV322]|nr:YfhE-like protein [Bacillus sp. OV322]
MEAKKKDRTKSTLTSTQAVLYAREFKHADRAGGFDVKRGKR